MPQSTPVPFTNAGLVQKKDPAQLADGEHYQLDNAWSAQEGMLTARTGHQRLVPAAAGAIVSISKLNLGGADPVNPRYLGAGTAIYRTSPAYYGQGQALVVGSALTRLSGTPFNVAWVGANVNVGGSVFVIATVTDIDHLAVTGSPTAGASVPWFMTSFAPLSVYGGLVNGQRWSAMQYNAGTTGSPTLYFATTSAAIRDSTIFGTGFTTLQKWGIDPPPIPAIAYPANPNFANVGDAPGTAGQRFIAGTNANAPDGSHLTYNWKGIVAIQVLSPAGSATGYTKITPDPTAPANGLDGIYVGMQINIGDPITLVVESTVVLAVDQTSLYVWQRIAHPLANAPFLIAGQSTLTVPGSMFNGYTPTAAYVFNAAYNGLAVDGYDSTDVFHFGITFSAITAVTSVKIQLVPNYQGAPYASDYYEYEVKPALLSASANAATAEFWTEFAIPKNKFTKVGNAGSGPYNWSNINEVYVVAAGTASTIKVSGLFFVGGGGLNSYAAGTTPYDYMYTYRNPTTHIEGNPSALMIDPNIPPPVANSSMQLLLTGSAGNVAVQSSGIWELSGPGSINIYRRGGTFADGFWRHVGYAANPGNSTAVSFVDSASDASIATAQVLEFDNDPPVPSTLRTPLTATIVTFQPVGGGADSNTSAETVVLGTVNTVATAVTWVSGLTFDPAWASPALTINIHGVTYTIASVTDPTHLVLTATAGTQSGVNYFMPTLAQVAQVTNGLVRVVLGSLPTNFTASTIAATITVGSTFTVGTGNSFEQVIITNVGYNTTSHTTSAWFEAYLQFNHWQSANAAVTYYDPSDTIECDTILRGTCDLVYQDFDCIFLAGDANNAATLYQSKVGRPESFPVLNLENNFAQQINVGSPSNPINGITSIGPGELVCLNLNNIFIVNVWQGQMQQPIKVPASRGLYAKWCWTKGDNRIWYLAYDGIYSWAGGESRKVSEQIDYMFKNQVVNGIAPVDMTDMTLAMRFSFAYAENALFVACIDTNGLWIRLRYETNYNRWTREILRRAATGASAYSIDCLFAEPDTGNLLVAVTNPGS